MTDFHAYPPAQPQPESWHTPFLAMLPKIRACLQSAFANLHYDAREEAVQEGLANALAAFRRLYELGKQDLAYPTVLARFAAAQVRQGRQVAEKLNVRDVSSRHCQRVKGVHLQPLDRFDRETMVWREVLVEDRRADPAATAAARIDFAAFLQSLSPRERRIAMTLAGRIHERGGEVVPGLGRPHQPVAPGVAGEVERLSR